MCKVMVDLGTESYEILIGTKLTENIRTFVLQASFSKTVLVISDNNVGTLYGNALLDLLKQAGFQAEIIFVVPGESSKSLTVADGIYTKAIELGLDRKSPIVALGGGVVGDLAGFVAATYMRGVPFIQIPTSLLAQVDSSVGGKVAVNHRLGKNLIGAFYQPSAVFMDLDMLKTLPNREIYTGLAEIIKYGIIYDQDFFSYLDQHAKKILALESTVLAHIIHRSCEIKAEVVSQDEKESGLRIILNFGHTLAHAIESETNYEVYNHGEAVAIGMYGAARLSWKLGLIHSTDVELVKNMLEKFHLPIKAQQCTVDGLFKSIFHDKKAVNGKVKWVLIESIGKVRTMTDIADDLVKEVMSEIIL
ncbi:3-dehydroquinate synthase [Propionispira arboris]|uniref:3-dehydroquinate synthase n=1 Tax=Propionispira arboris TaxID=84035 RepID=A0A1H6VWK8_9FIRM|nr:3-dehydroquinate synthase [Propionispira arboris]SEJ09003.1 3-dehydroquinate synthase [Propionispira arboris]